MFDFDDLPDINEEHANSADIRKEVVQLALVTAENEDCTKSQLPTSPPAPASLATEASKELDAVDVPEPIAAASESPSEVHAEGPPLKERSNQQTEVAEPAFASVPAQSLEVAKGLLNDGCPNDAESMADELLDMRPAPSGLQNFRLRKLRLEAWLHPAYRSHKPKEKKQLMSFAKKLEDEQPSDVSMQALIGRILFLDGKRKEAEEVWKRASRRDQESQRLLKSLVILEDEKARGNAAFKDGKWDVACEAYTRGLEADALRLDREMCSAVLGNRSAANRKLAKFNKALTDAEESAVLNPSYVKAIFRKGLAKMELERYSEALSDLQEVKRKEPTTAGLEEWLIRAEHWAGGGLERVHGKPNKKPTNHYAKLELPMDCTQEEIKKAYKRTALVWHPDKAEPDRRDEAEERFKEIQKAFEVLSDEKARELYDFGRAKHAPVKSAPTTPVDMRPMPKSLVRMGWTVRKGDGKNTCICCGYAASTDDERRHHCATSGHPGFYETDPSRKAAQTNGLNYGNFAPPGMTPGQFNHQRFVAASGGTRVRPPTSGLG